MSSDVLKFGNDLELDRGAYELRRSGRPLKLERIPMELLLLLVERKGQLVTREEIIERVWGKDLFFDTDNSINAAVRKIRQALKDDPEKPRFVQTVTGKGYRFVAPTVEGPVPTEGISQTFNRNAGSAGLTVETKTTGPRDWRVISLAAVGVLGLSVVGFIFLQSRRTSKLTEKDTIVLGDFTNTTGD
ncbi:MAG TPA: winged helix-turn-helix domain-containing protein, partial [Terriglobia bacterium]|nr:winged helix-turn-helix domain-containing protein [Terriglobia bacterium]